MLSTVGSDAPAAPVVSEARVAVPAKKGPSVQWRKQKHDIDELPAEMPEPAREAVRTWADWCLENELVATLNDDGRVLLLTSKRSRPDKRMALVERTARHFDAVLPLPASRVADTTPPERAGMVQQGDPAAEDRPQDGEPEDDGRYTSWTWLEDGGPLETETAVIFELDTRADQAKVIEKLREQHDYLAGFDASGLAGFSLERPLVAAWLSAEPENEEWSADAELVHRTATLLFLRRFGRQPFWLQTGVAWHVEQALLGGMWCFPYRAEFIWAVEHTEWPARLAKLFEDRGKSDFDLGEVARWQRGTFQPSEALLAWGVVTWFASERPGVLSEVLEDLRRYRDEHDRLDDGNGTWRRIPGWEVPAAAQREAFERRTSAGVWQQLTQDFKRAKSAAWAKAKARG